MTVAKPPLKGKKFLELSFQKLGETLSCIPSVNDVALKSTGCFPLSFWALSVVKPPQPGIWGERGSISAAGGPGDRERKQKMPTVTQAQLLPGIFHKLVTA